MTTDPLTDAIQLARCHTVNRQLVKFIVELMQSEEQSWEVWRKVELKKQINEYLKR
jgi:hypothetical protein